MGEPEGVGAAGGEHDLTCVAAREVVHVHDTRGGRARPPIRVQGRRVVLVKHRCASQVGVVPPLHLQPVDALVVAGDLAWYARLARPVGVELAGGRGAPRVGGLVLAVVDRRCAQAVGALHRGGEVLAVPRGRRGLARRVGVLGQPGPGVIGHGPVGARHPRPGHGGRAPGELTVPVGGRCVAERAGRARVALQRCGRRD